MRNRVVDDLFQKTYRTAEAFHARLEELDRDGISGRGQKKRSQLIDLLDTYMALRMKMHSLRKTYAGQHAQVLLDELELHLKRLMPKNFVQLYDNTRMLRMMRYLQAISLRAERGVVGPDKDRIKSAQIEPFANKLEDIVNELTPQSSLEKRQAIEDFFWLLEEFKISVFAQEIRTAQPVSAKRLHKHLEHLESLV